MRPHTNRFPRSAALPAALAALGRAPTACGGGGSAEEAGGEDAPAKVENPVVATYDGGIYIIDPESLDVVEDIELEGFNRLNPAGDGRHVLVSTSTGFRVLDAAGAELTDG